MSLSKGTLAFVAGAVSGAAVATLTAPRSGEETRAQIKNRVNEKKEHARDKKDAYKERLSSMASRKEKELEAEAEKKA